MKARRIFLGLLLLGWLVGGAGASRLRADEPSGTSTIHRVRAGDTVARICWQYKVRDEFIRDANPGLAEPLRPGQLLVIPLGPGPDVAADPPSPAPRMRSAPVIATPAPAPVIMVARAVVAPPLPPPPLPPAQVPEPSVADMPAAVEPGPGREEESRTAGPPTSQRVDFTLAARALAAQRLRYNQRWRPPGEREPWVMDCSNTSRYLYLTVAGVDIGRTASDQYYFLKVKHRAWDVPTGWDHLPRLDYLRKHLEPGDLLFWENTYKPVRDPDITHVMVYLGHDEDGRWQMAGSQASAGVSIYRFDPQVPKGGYSSWFGLVHHEGRFVAYGRPL
jgi:cell wall-associated NlpC family hydrolase